MSKKVLPKILIFILITLLFGLIIWSIWFVDKVENQISIYTIVAVILAAVTSIVTVSINNAEAKEREYGLLILKEKQKVYDHFYNALFDSLLQAKGNRGVSNKAVVEIMSFKKGLMNWGSEDLINKFIEYETNLVERKDAETMVKDGNNFLKEIRKEMGFKDSKELNLMSVILTADARKKLVD